MMITIRVLQCTHPIEKNRNGEAQQPKFVMNPKRKLDKKINKNESNK